MTTSHSSLSQTTDHAKPASLAIVMIVKNEEQSLRDCLHSVADLADQIVIVDSGSTDATAAIAREFKADFHSHTDWPGYGKQRQIAQQYVHCDWVFWLDADERMTPQLRQSIERVLKQSSSYQQTVFSVARLSWAFGRFIKHCGWYPGYVERFYPHALTTYDDALVHESVIVPAHAQVQTLDGDLLHYTYRNLQDYLTKSANYAQAWAQQKYQAGKRTSLLAACGHSFGRFFRTYIFKKGFLDGSAGFLLTLFACQSVFNKYAALYLKQKEKHASQHSTTSTTSTSHENS
ncbi:glycosyltransferase family 2 protein [Brackiella oedipodis]|uniref:glycosyltransferase family 2 protein n=1 Tax=Brackiella oedipodis TaxID=124225 RepID=UPI0006882D30|nr:glycosyltransferase family 2 protein [Brackiella oedipodis]